MKKILNFIKHKYGLILGCLLGIVFGFSLISFVINIATPATNNSSALKVSALDTTIYPVSCTSFSCGTGECGVVCCIPRSKDDGSSASVDCKTYTGADGWNGNSVSW